MKNQSVSVHGDLHAIKLRNEGIRTLPFASLQLTLAVLLK